MRYCSNCGSPIEDNAKFCENCGQPMEIVSQPQTQIDNVNNANDVNSQHGYYDQKPNMNNQNNLNNPNLMNNQNRYQQPPKQSNGCLIAFFVALGVVALLIIMVIIVPAFIGYNARKDEIDNTAGIPEIVAEAEYTA
jgi:uncharacterized membrane protein YvbJ